MKVRGLGVRGTCSVHVHVGDRTVPAWKGDGLRPARCAVVVMKASLQAFAQVPDES